MKTSIKVCVSKFFSSLLFLFGKKKKLFGQLLTWGPLKHSTSLRVFPTFNTEHRTHTVSPPPSFSFHFLISSFLCFFVTYHQTYWILHDRPFWWGGRQKRHALKAGADSHFSQGVVGNLHSFPFWPTPLSPPFPRSAHLDFVKSLERRFMFSSSRNFLFLPF